MTLLGAASIAGVVLWRRRSRDVERVDLYFADGSMVSFHRDSPEAVSLLPHAYDILAAARAGV
jgi:hypothetical protein